MDNIDFHVVNPLLRLQKTLVVICSSVSNLRCPRVAGSSLPSEALPGQWSQTAVLNFTQKPSQHKTLRLHLIQYIKEDERVSDASPDAARC